MRISKARRQIIGFTVSLFKRLNNTAPEIKTNLIRIISAYILHLFHFYCRSINPLRKIIVVGIAKNGFQFIKAIMMTFLNLNNEKLSPSLPMKGDGKNTL
ncbi:hypothetical protein DOX71_19255 [Cronobacter sakazakii]|nr:hypothetical protein [Cronobacter sakazakii]PPY55230.1 hypothetical protein C3D79_00050 [Cronobacter sakazakii]PQY22142.1 hypothetical protein C5964_01110 [Cronobacter sakazakii]PQY45076.1 hypothetical protein C5959_21295 [Cronobacter sakazakii]